MLSRYDDVLALRGRKDYEPGDTLKLIVPFLLYHGITEGDILNTSRRARIIPGALETITELKKTGWKVRIISTSYEQHALNIGRQLDVGEGDIACTRLPMDDYLSELENKDFGLVEEMEEKILDYSPGIDDEGEMVSTLDKFFFHDLLETPLGKVFQEISVVGGERKVRAMQGFMDLDGIGYGDVVAVGDSITDFKMLAKVRGEDGLAIVFNGNEYAVPYADVGLATMDMRSILPVLESFSSWRKDGALDRVRRGVSVDQGYGDPPPVYHPIIGGNVDDVVRVHKEYRKLARGEAGKLG